MYSRRITFISLTLTLTYSVFTLADHRHTTASNLHAIEEVVIEHTPLQNVTIIELPDRLVADTAELLKSSPGANINSNGPLTGLAQIRGLYGQRVNTKMNGSKIASGGPNLMDPPLSYAPASTLEELKIYRDIAPVSAGQETLGGAIVATSWRPAFNESRGANFSGRMAAGYESVNQSTEALVLGAIANRNHKAMLSLLDNRGDDSEFDGGDIKPTEFERQRGEFAYAFRTGSHTVEFSFMRSETGDAGTPALPMDIEYIDTDSTQLSYDYNTGSWGTKFIANHAEVEHEMTNFHLRPVMDMNNNSIADDRRANLATGDSDDAHIQLWFKTDELTWRTGIDYHNATHNSDISNPDNQNFFVTNFNDANQEIVGFYIELESPADSATQVRAGLRANSVSCDASAVNGTPAMMNAAAGNLRDAFNAADRSNDELNIDAVISISQQLTQKLNLVTSIGRKNRSASYQERYLWLPMRATAGLADGNTYVGNIELKAETSNEASIGFDFKSETIFLSPRIFYKKIDDYIQGTPVTDAGTIMFSSMMMNDATPLEFNNIEAELYGGDLQTAWEISDHWRFESIVSYVRGTRDDTDDDLYRIAPLNGLLSATYAASSWQTSLELQAAAAQNKVSEINNENPTSGYSFWNIHAQKALAENIQLSAGVKNLFDKVYVDHLSGVNRAADSGVATGSRIPGNGRSFYSRLMYSF